MPTTLPVLPMGSIMAGCMLIGAIAVAATAAARRAAAPRAALLGIAALMACAALWQLGWYFPRHPTTRWGLAALASGALLAAGAAWCGSRRARLAVPAARWPVAAGLGALALVYGVTIVRL